MYELWNCEQHLSPVSGSLWWRKYLEPGGIQEPSKIAVSIFLRKFEKLMHTFFLLQLHRNENFIEVYCWNIFLKIFFEEITSKQTAFMYSKIDFWVIKDFWKKQKKQKKRHIFITLCLWNQIKQTHLWCESNHFFFIFYILLYFMRERPF